jgi:hypothetical protein
MECTCFISALRASEQFRQTCAEIEIIHQAKFFYHYLPAKPVRYRAPILNVPLAFSILRTAAATSERMLPSPIATGQFYSGRNEYD